MHNTVQESDSDEDLGSGGAMILPDLMDSQGQVHHLAVGAGKDSNIYVVDRDNMGKFNPNDDSAIYQEIDGALPGGVWAMPAYFNNTVYYGSVSSPLKAFGITNAILSTSPTSQTSTSFTYPGTTPSVSANGTSNGIVWAIENTSPAVLHAYDATNLSHELYNSNQAWRTRHDGDLAAGGLQPSGGVREIPSPEAIVTDGKRSATRSRASTSRRARSAPSGPERVSRRVCGHANQAPAAAWWLVATITWSWGPMPTVRSYAARTVRAWPMVKSGPPARFSRSTTWRVLDAGKRSIPERRV